ncbi:membrane-spanning 4-domains subfamily A member 4A-like isoform X2 [Colossoma macropomum]|uniref:membrane-spanning 4-domains subfamily A member 4A-like isoform X2 n=1 Tax=Colossoma macropomum TaxID=42526 RepID=UPI001864985E|nr:membrane-spanning 4-domains subfamily A member 4A-like isoform X2 [Colossoma macropomum]XP_036427254.1 membrane-spanning 4-domains subfamily A member 4A-like isoform X2 [Colossoma macropomum]
MSSATVMDNYPRNDFMVVTHGIPPAITGQNGAGAGPGVLTLEAPSWRFERAESKALGSMQIVIGFIYFVCGIVMAASTSPISFYIGVYFWGALTYIITGSLTVTANNSSNRCLVNSSVGMNVLSVVTAGIIVTLLAVDIADGLGFKSCHNIWNSQCFNFKHNAIRLLLLGVSAFQLIVSITMSVFGCKAACFTEPVVTAVSVVPSQAACSTVVSPFLAHSSQQDVFYITNTDTNLNCPPTEDPPAYSVCVTQSK